MPVYKIPRRGEQEQRERFFHSRLRLVTLVVSGLLFLATAALVLSHLMHFPA